MGLDIGDRRIGIAISDPEGILATPTNIIDRRDETRDIAAIIEIVDRRGIEKIIAGLPLSLDGGIGQQATKIKAFVEVLASWTQVPVELRDESLTTVEARRIMLTSRSKRNRRKSKDDDVAAAVLLQSYLDEKSGL